MTPLFNSLPKVINSRWEYQWVCDGLVWSDELPKVALTDRQEQAIRYLLNYRTGLILREANSSLEPLWNKAKSAFPRWPGFAPERCVPTEELVVYVENARKKLEDFLKENADA